METRLDRLALEDEDSGSLTIVVETPRGSRNKYKYDGSCHALRLGALLPEGLAFPFDFGLPPGCIVNARLIGAIEVEQKDASRSWKRNDRFLAVGSHSSNYADVARLQDLRPQLLDEIEASLAHYVTMAGKKLRIAGRAGPRPARRRLKAGQRAWQRRAVQ